MELVLVCAAVFIGAFSQRLAGMGFALVSAPFLVLLMGPQSGVLLVNLCGLVSSVFVLTRMHRHIEWKHSLPMGISAVIGSIPGAVLAAVTPQAPLETVIGILVIVSLVASLVLSVYTQPIARTIPRTILTGGIGGVMGAAAGVSGPAFSAYAVLSKWNQQSFAASVQPVFVIASTAAVGSKLVVSPTSAPELSLWSWVLIAAALVLGQLVGDVCARYVAPAIARRMMLTFAFAGGVLAIVKGIAGMMAA